MAPSDLSPAARYAPLLQDVGAGEEKEELAAEPRIESRHDDSIVLTFTVRKFVICIALWALGTALMIVLGAEWLQRTRAPRGIVMQRGEFAPAGDAVEVEEVLFIASALFNDSARPPRQFLDIEPLYVGDPSPELDRAWDELLDDQYFYISDEEAHHYWGDGYDQYYRNETLGGYRAGLDVFHTLHCLNTVRKEVYRDHYRVRPLKGYYEQLQTYHVDHCIDVIRQSLQCASDLTPIPVRWYEPESGRQTIDSERVHTCRNNKKLREWMTGKVAQAKSLA